MHLRPGLDQIKYVIGEVSKNVNRYGPWVRLDGEIVRTWYGEISSGMKICPTVNLNVTVSSAGFKHLIFSSVTLMQCTESTAIILGT